MNPNPWTRKHRTLDIRFLFLSLLYFSASSFYPLILHYRRGTPAHVPYGGALEILIQGPGNGGRNLAINDSQRAKYRLFQNL